MKFRIEFILLPIVLIVIFALWNRQGFTSNNISSVLVKDTVLTLKDWYLAYPDSMDDELEDKCIRIEQTGSLKDFYNQCVNDSDLHIGTVKMPDYMLDIRDLFNKMEKTYTSGSFVYMACNIDSPEDMQAVLSANINQSCKMYLNEELVYVSDFRRSPSKFREEFIPVQFKKGRNYLLMKAGMCYPSELAWRWKVLVDCINTAYAERLFKSAYHRHFLKRSILPEETDTLKLYAGPYSGKQVDVTVKKYNSDSVVLSKSEFPDRITGVVKVGLENNLHSGLYTCRMQVSDADFQQTFFVGDDSVYFDSIKKQISAIPGLPEHTRLDLDALELRNPNYGDSDKDFDDFFEPTNRIKVPRMETIHNLFSCLNSNKNPDSLFFLKAYHSNTLDTTFHYSVHIPEAVQYGDSVTLFVMLYHDEPVYWLNHWRNYLDNGLSNVMDVAERNNCIMVWTNCGKQAFAKATQMCGEIFDDLQTRYQLTKDKTILLGNCASTELAHDLLIGLEDRVGGVGFINPLPLPVSTGFLKAAKDKKMGIICAFHDEEIPFENNINLLESLQRATPFTKMIVSTEATHHISPEDYIEPLVQWFCEEND